MCREPSWEGGRGVWFRVRVASQAPLFFYHAGPPNEAFSQPVITVASLASMINILILDTRTLRHKEGRKLTQGYTTDNQMYLSPDPVRMDTTAWVSPTERRGLVPRGPL